MLLNVLSSNKDSLLGTSHGDSFSVDSYSRLDIREGCLGAATCPPGEAQVDDTCDVIRMLSVHESLSSMINGCRPVPRLLTSFLKPLALVNFLLQRKEADFLSSDPPLIDLILSSADT